MILSASRRTDIPAHFSQWFLGRLKEGHVLVRNPMNPHQVSRISLSPEVVDCIVFWSKNPLPLLAKLDQLQGYAYYFQFSLTPYAADIEAKLPPKEQILGTFLRLSEQIGPDRVVWRYDPILLSPRYTVESHIDSFGRLASRLRGHTHSVVISFLDLYPKIRGRLTASHIQPVEEAAVHRIATAFSAIARENGMTIETCAERVDLSPYGIGHSRCIDDRRIASLLGCGLAVEKDRNQRQECGCVSSVDIGTYNTCPNGCIYCYANQSGGIVPPHPLQHPPDSPLLGSFLQKEDRVSDRPQASIVQGQQSLF